MKTETSKDIVSNESLEDAAKLFLKRKDDETGTIWTEDDEDIIKSFCDFHKEQLKPLLESQIKELQNSGTLIDFVINAIPTGSTRNLLTDANIILKTAIDKLLNSIK